MSPANEHDDELLAVIGEELAGMSEGELEAEAAKVLAAQEKRKEYRQGKTLSEEEKDKRRLYRRKKYLKEKAIIAKAKEVGIVE